MNINHATSLRRIITENNQDGRSVIAIDGPPSQHIEWSDGSGLYEIWTEAPGMDNSSIIPESIEPLSLCPPAGGFKVRWFTAMPGLEGEPGDDFAKTTSEAFASIGAADLQPDTSRHAAMHTTQTIDAIIVVSGQVRLILDDEERLLSAGDVVMQRGTNHAWAAVGDEPVVMVAVLIDREK